MFTPTFCGLTCVYQCKNKVDLKHIVENNFKINNIDFQNGQLINTSVGDVIEDANPFFSEKTNKFAEKPEGIYQKTYAISHNIMYYSYPGTLIPRGTICIICGVNGPGLHNTSCSSPLKSSLYLNADGIEELLGSLSRNNNKSSNVLTKLQEFVNNNKNFTRQNMEEFGNDIPLSSLDVEKYKIKNKKEKQFNASMIILTYYYEAGDRKRSNRHVNDKNNKTHTSSSIKSIQQSLKKISIRISIPKNNEIKVNIIAQPWNKKNFYTNISKELKNYVYDTPDIYITSATLDKIVEYSFDLFFEKIYEDRKYIIKRPNGLAPIINGPYENDPIKTDKEDEFDEDSDNNDNNIEDAGRLQKVLILYNDIYYSIVQCHII